ncbi:MAG: hypothetical protein BZY73_00585 [SAR202 cluster bacterium Casp-Chloro-G3]|nr:MAG: hypothetical protein BZY73_00585 [SAR202 cluster bacterium Casp-Chloro-G3]
MQDFDEYKGIEMTTVTEREPQVTRTECLNRPAPVEMVENDAQGCAWLNLAGEWLKIVSVKNLWDIDGHDTGEKPFIRMHFRVMVEDGRQILLFQDLIDGSWYQDITLASSNYAQPTPIYRT